MIDFCCTWCSPCKRTSPNFETVSNETTGVEFYKVDVYEAEDVSKLAEIKVVRRIHIDQVGYDLMSVMTF